jgi:hypothetical protein
MDQVVIDDSGSLHKGITYCCSNKGKSSLFQVFADNVRER